MVEKIIHRFHDSRPYLPLDPDSEQLAPIKRPMHTDPMHIMVVAVGGFAGTICRYLMGLWFPAGMSSWPVAVLAVNVTGAFLLGLLLEVLLRRGNDEGIHRVLRLLLGTGFLGAYTTYSTLAVGTIELAKGSFVRAALYMAGSVIAGMAAAAIGIYLAAYMGGKR